jgi:type IV pilus assembly protein PilE
MKPTTIRLCAKPPTPQRAFTLIEIMIVVVIVAILAAIAIPSYNEYVTRGRLVNATNELAGLRTTMERHFQDNRTYLTSGAFVSPCAATSLATLNTRLADLNLVMSCPAATLTANTYTLSVSGNGPLAGFTFTLNHLNAQATTAAPTGWDTNANRWCVRRGC